MKRKISIAERFDALDRASVMEILHQSYQLKPQRLVNTGLSG